MALQSNLVIYNYNSYIDYTRRASNHPNSKVSYWKYAKSDCIWLFKVIKVICNYNNYINYIGRASNHLNICEQVV